VKSERPGSALLRSLNVLTSLLESFQTSKDLLTPPLSAIFSVSIIFIIYTKIKIYKIRKKINIKI